MQITFDQIRDSAEIRTYIERADLSLKALGYTEHSFPHVGRVVKVSGDLLNNLGYDANRWS